MDKECKRCGECCMLTDHIDITDRDIKNWEGTPLESNGLILELDYFGSQPKIREHIFKAIKSEIPNHSEHIEDGCPFLIKKDDKYGCFIQGDLKPEMCQEFKPGSKHAKQFCKCKA